VTHIDFTNKARRARLFAARDLITQGYRILRDDVGADNPADNAFLREATACATAGLIWVGDRGGTDARTRTGEEVEIKSTRLDKRSTMAFPTSRYVSPTVIARFRAAGWWLFAVFDVYEEMVALYRVEGIDMSPLIDALERRMQTRVTRGVPLENNPKFPFREIRPLVSQVLYFDRKKYEERQSGGTWTIVRRTKRSP
jgi:hypothetical protein